MSARLAALVEARFVVGVNGTEEQKAVLVALAQYATEDGRVGIAGGDVYQINIDRLLMATPNRAARRAAKRGAR